jgi:general secretion pathway protein D
MNGYRQLGNYAGQGDKETRGLCNEAQLQGDKSFFPSVRFTFIIAVALSFFTVTLAQDAIDVFLKKVMLGASIEGEDTFVFKSDSQIRYYADYSRYVLTLPDGVLVQSEVQFPASVVVTQSEEGVVLELAKPYRVTLSGDEHTLVIVRGEELGADPHLLLADDERSPVMYRLANAEASEAAAFLSGMYDSLKIEVDERQRAIYVLMNPGDKPLIDELIKSFDSPRPQVMFEAEIIEINQSITESLGIDYDSLFSFTLTEAPAGDSTAAGFALNALGGFARNGLQLKFGINLLKSNSAAEVLARPRVTTMDGVEAQLNATQNFPILSSGENGQKSVQSITTGITLRMLPRIAPDGTIEADLSISVSTPTGITSDKVPTFSSRDASTTVRVANGESIVIGGLLEKRNLQGQDKVPLLGDIPLLGPLLFTNTSTEQRQTDLVIVVTPRIVDMPEMTTVGVDELVTEPGVTEQP